MPPEEDDENHDTESLVVQQQQQQQLSISEAADNKKEDDYDDFAVDNMVDASIGSTEEEAQHENANAGNGKQETDKVNESNMGKNLSSSICFDYFLDRYPITHEEVECILCLFPKPIEVSSALAGLLLAGMHRIGIIDTECSSRSLSTTATTTTTTTTAMATIADLENQLRRILVVEESWLGNTLTRILQWAVRHVCVVVGISGGNDTAVSAVEVLEQQSRLVEAVVSCMGRRGGDIENTFLLRALFDTCVDVGVQPDDQKNKDDCVYADSAELCRLMDALVRFNHYWQSYNGIIEPAGTVVDDDDDDRTMMNTTIDPAPPPPPPPATWMIESFHHITADPITGKFPATSTTCNNHPPSTATTTTAAAATATSASTRRSVSWEQWIAWVQTMAPALPDLIATVFSHYFALGYANRDNDNNCDNSNNTNGFLYRNKRPIFRLPQTNVAPRIWKAPTDRLPVQLALMGLTTASISAGASSSSSSSSSSIKSPAACQWRRLYCSDEDGLAFTSFQSALLGFSGPTMILIMTTDGDVFGYVTDVPWRTALTPQWFTAIGRGRDDSCLFRLLPDWSVYRLQDHKDDDNFQMPELSGKKNPHRKFHQYLHVPKTARLQQQHLTGLAVGGLANTTPRLHINTTLEQCVACSFDTVFQAGPLRSNAMADTASFAFNVDLLQVWAVRLSDTNSFDLCQQAGRRQQSIREGIRLRTAHVDKTSFIHDFANGTFDNQLYAHRDQAHGRASFVVSSEPGL